ncbi:hypothetical protein [Clostridium sp. ZBS13]|uniref:hypothetical protein n=1 Tax=Clostridium sp. ZBS13 TaxID=2949971 RepID=UPI00207998DC|nr:hypothetical protein [Clostridium sp. ZBS13]
MKESIINLKRNIQELKSKIIIMGNYFQCLEEKQALSLISEFTNELYNFYSELTNMKNSNIDDEIFLNLNKLFNNIVECIKYQDYIYLGDIFMYELLPTVIRVESIFNE